MSFSFNIKSADKATAKADVAAQLQGVAIAQPAHVADVPLIQATVDSYIDLLGEDPSKDVSLSVNGSIQTNTAGPSPTSLSLGVRCGYESRPAVVTTDLPLAAA